MVYSFNRQRSDYSSTSGDILGYEYLLTEKTREMDDNVIENYKTRSAKGEVFCNYMQQRIDSKESPFWKSCYTGLDRFGKPIAGEYTSPVWCNFLPLPDEDTEEINDLQDIAVTQANAGVGADQLDLIASIGELDETVKTVIDVSIKASKIFRDLRKFNLRAIAKRFSVRDVREQYLEFRYGLRPLYYDLKGVHDYLKTEICHDRQTSRGYSEGSVSISNDTYNWVDKYIHPWSSRPVADVLYARSTKLRITCRSGVLYAFQFSDDLSKILSEVGVDRPISSCWELIPFSFMIDWFWRVGDTIRSWEPKPHCSTLASWCTVKSEQISEIMPTGINYTNVAYGATVLSSSITEATVARKCFTTITRIPNPSVSIIPPFDVNLSSAKLLDMVAIFWGLKESKRRQRW